MLNNQRPVLIPLGWYKFPCTAIVSILHRMTGVLLFLLIPFLLWGLSYSLSSDAHFTYLQSILSAPIPKLFLTLFLAALVYHLFAGLRHIIMDLGFAEGVSCARASSWGVFVLSAVVIVLIGCRLWL